MSIEAGKIYEVSKVNTKYYYIASMGAWFSTKLFISLEEFRSKKLEEIGI